MLQLLQRIRQHADNRGAAVAFTEVGPNASQSRSISYRHLAASIADTACRINQSTSECAVIAVCLPNTLECAVAFLAILQANRAAFLINPVLAGAELCRAIHACGAKAIFADENTEVNAACPQRLNVEFGRDGQLQASAKADRAALLLLSSGTTQEPKIVYRDGPSLDAVARNCAEAVGVNQDDRVLLTIPLCHSYGVEHGILMPLHAGAAVHLCRGIEPSAIIPELEGGKVTLIPGVPSMYEMLAGLSQPLRCSSIRCAYSAGAPLPSSIFDACNDRLGLRVGQLYGSSEVGSVTFNDPRRVDHDLASVGQPMHGVEIRIVNPDTRDLSEPLPAGVEGEVAIRSPSMLRHYVGQAGCPFRDGFFLTEDLGLLSDSGDLTITGRIKLLIDVGALKVNPFEVEHAFKTHPAVADCLVVGVPVSQTVHRLKAMVVPRDAALPPDAGELRAYARERLSAPKIPRIIEFVGALPRSATGKVLRRMAVT